MGEVMEDGNYARNAKTVAIMYIVFYALGLEMSDELIRLGPFAYKINNPEYMPVIGGLILFYFSWRFKVSKKQGVLNEYHDQVKSVFRGIKEERYLNDALKAQARIDYLEKHEAKHKKRLLAEAKEEIKDFHYEFNISLNFNDSLSRCARDMSIGYSAVYPALSGVTNNFKSVRISVKGKEKFFVVVLSGFKYVFNAETFWDVIVVYILLSFAWCLYINDIYISLL